MEIKTYAPVLIPTLNRYEHLKRCVESLARNTHAEKTELIIGLDYPPSEKYVEGWQMICDYVSNISGFSKVTVLKREKNLGALINWQMLKEYAKERYECFISSEDDNEFSPNFLDYMNKGLTAYKDNPKVLGICGYNYLNIDMSSYKRDFYFSHEMSAWGWGSWFNERCLKVEETIQKPDFLFDLLRKISLKDFIKDGTKRCNLLFDIGLDYRGDAYYTYYEWNHDMYCMFPRVSLVRNHGYDGSGLHCGDENSDKFINQPIDNRIVFEDDFDIPVCYNKDIRRILGSFQRGALKKKIQKIVLLVLMKLFVKLRRY